MKNQLQCSGKGKKAYTLSRGLSMGGAGALKLALKYDENFGCRACILVSAVFTEESIIASDSKNSWMVIISQAMPEWSVQARVG